MRAVIARRGKLVVEEVPEPAPEPGDALVAIRECGICGSDLHTLRHPEALPEVAAVTGLDAAGLHFDPEADFHLGHEWVCEVLELGPGTAPAPVAPGDLVVCLPYLVRQDALVPLGFSNEFYGGYAERCLLSVALCLKVPNGLDPRRAALTEPMSVGLRTVERSGIAPGDAAAVIGCGPIGLSLIAWMVARGIEPIVAADFSAQRRAYAAALGAHAVVDPRAEPVVDAWRRIDGIRPLVIFEAVGVPGMLDEMIYAAPPRSRVVVAGVCMQPDTIRPLLAVVKELEVRFVFGSEPDEFAAALHAIAEGVIDVSSLVTGIVGLDGVPDAFEMLGRAEHHVKVLVEPGGPTAVSPVTSETLPAA